MIAALRDLQWRRRRFLIAVLGTAIVFSMTLVLAGLSAAFGVEVDDTLDTIGVDAWVVADGVTGAINSSAMVPVEMLERARSLPGVSAADPYVSIRGTLGDEDLIDVGMFGAAPGGVGSPKVDEGRAPQTSGEVAVSSRLDEELGNTVEISGRQFEVVGLVHNSSLYGGTPNVFLTIGDVQEIVFAGQPLFSSIAMIGTPEAQIDGAKIVDREQERSDLLRALGAARQTIDAVGILLWIVAACIVGSIVYMSALERVRDFAVFKATGASASALLGGLAAQAVILSLAAALVGTLTALIMAPRFPMPSVIPTSAFVALPVVAVVVGCFASLAGLRRAVTVSPALAFGGA